MSFFPQGAFYGLGLMGKSLSAFQFAENVTADDIANVNTPGASQQVAVLTQAAPIAGSPGYDANVGGTFGDGVNVTDIQRIHSNSYDQLFRGASSSQNYFQVEQNTLNAVQSSFGDPSSGVNAQFTAFQSAVNQLVAQSAVGNSNAYAQNVIVGAQALAQALNNDAATVKQQENSVLQQAGALIDTVNGLLDDIATLNGQIRAAKAAGDSPNTYEDQRDYDIDQLSQYLSTQTSIQADGSALVTVDGQALVNDTVAYHLAQPVIGSASNGAAQFEITFAGGASSQATASSAIPLGSGQLAAFADLYNNKLSVYGQKLDQFASALANEVNRITTAGYTANGNAGSALFQPIVATLPISAANIKVGIQDASQLPTVMVSTISGSLITPLVSESNSSTNTIDPSAQLTKNGSLLYPPQTALTGTLTIQLGQPPVVTNTFKYNTAAGGNADTIDDFITNFNAGRFGVTASFDPSSQKIVFTRDPSNESLALRAQLANNPEPPSFTITDSNWTSGQPQGSLLGVLGAGGSTVAGTTGINGVPQDASNAFGAGDNGVANALVDMFASSVGVPALQFKSPAAATAGTPVTVAIPTGSFYSTTVQVGQILTIDAQPGGGSPQENVTVTAVSFDPSTGRESVTFTPQNNHGPNYSITSAQVQTLGEFYGDFVTQVGLDAQTANTGVTTQTTLANNINQVRQSISGINIDEETQNLIKYQSAYTAAAQTINVLNQILNTTITSLGVGQ
jgi:flagellar hook-associated protein 1 FlgK